MGWEAFVSVAARKSQPRVNRVAKNEAYSALHLLRAGSFARLAQIPLQAKSACLRMAIKL
jgi:hypothetical protein